MSKKRGLSLEEKREKLLELYTEKPNAVFQLKELEKRAAKEKKIVLQTVKDVNQALIDDGLVVCEKIGTCNYYWAFPSSTQQTKRAKVEKLNTKVSSLSETALQLKHENVQLKADRRASDARAEIAQHVETLMKEILEAEQNISTYTTRSSGHLEAARADWEVVKTAANAYTDALFVFFSWLRKQNPVINLEDVRYKYGIAPDMDYLE